MRVTRIWNEGPYVNAYHTNVVNNDFSAFANPDGYETIEYLGPAPISTSASATTEIARLMLAPG